MRSSASTVVVSAFVLAGAMFMLAERPQSAATVQSAEAASSIEAITDAAAGVTFKIVPVEAHASMVSWTPLTGDGSN